MTEEKEFFENVFRKENYKFSFEADEESIKEVLKYLKKGVVLDIGCGEGGDSLFLAKKGFKVLAIDYSKTAIKKLSDEAKKRNLTNLESKQNSIEEFVFEKHFDLIICIATLHFLKEKDSKNLINKSKNNTSLGGIHLFIILREGDPSQEENSEGYYFKNNELRKLYDGWEILEYKEYEEYDEEEDQYNKLAKIIAKKN